MVDESLLAHVAQQLELAGLQACSLDGPQAGGFAIQPDEGRLQVVWTPSDGLSQRAFQALMSGEVAHPAVLHMGEVKQVMAEAILRILVSAGITAEMSSDDMSPATVEVRQG